jgi:predicted dehydrogenase
MADLGVAIIGCGAIALANHVPGLALTRRAKLVALCDENQATLARAAAQTGVGMTYTDYRQLLQRQDIDAVIVATPNFTHPPIVLAAAAAKKHMLCEKPLALDVPTALQMYRAAEDAGIRHMTAFTYRFVPAMRYMKHLIDAGDIGQPFHFRAQRFQDWGERAQGWRQVKKLAGSGEMGDMLSHRIDYAHHLVGAISSVVADLRTFIPTRGGQPSDVDDWVALIARFNQSDATAVLESTKLATGRGEGHRGQDVVEINGSAGTIVYSTQKPLELQIGHRGDRDLHRIEVPREFWVYPGSPRDPSQGDPLVTFRYDQSFEFIDAISHNRACNPSLREGAMAQAVMDAAQLSHSEQKWVDVPQI